MWDPFMGCNPSGTDCPSRSLPRDQEFCQQTCSSVTSPLSICPQILPGSFLPESQPPFSIHLLQSEILQVAICSTVNLHQLQKRSLPHHGLHYKLQYLDYLLSHLLHQLQCLQSCFSYSSLWLQLLLQGHLFPFI